MIEELKQLKRYTDAELMGAVVSSFFTVFVKTKTPDEGPLGGLGQMLPDQMRAIRIRRLTSLAMVQSSRWTQTRM